MVEEDIEEKLNIRINYNVITKSDYYDEGRVDIFNGKRNEKKSFTYYIWSSTICSAYAFFRSD